MGSEKNNSSPCPREGEKSVSNKNEETGR